MRNMKIFIMVLAISAAVFAVAGLGMTDETSGTGGGAVMGNASSVTPAPAPLGTYSTPAQ
jgi:hypothetical protein